MSRLFTFLVASIVLVGCIQLLLLPSLITDQNLPLYHHQAIARSAIISSHHQKQVAATAPSDIYQILQCSSGASEETYTSALDLFCQAARNAMTLLPTHNFSNNTNNNNNNNNNRCDPNTDQGRERLFRIWEEARDQMDSTDLIRRALTMARGAEYSILNDRHQVTLWAPPTDIGITTVLKELKEDGYGMKDLMLPTLRSAAKDEDATTKSRKIYFVDIGANLGIISLSVALETAMIQNIRIVAIEAASPTWLFQQLNLRCNLEEETKAISILAGLDSKPGTLKMTWREHSTTSTRSWTPDNEGRDTDIELIVPTRTLRSIMEPLQPYLISCVKVDCEGSCHWAQHAQSNITFTCFVMIGCEYNVVPSLSDNEYASIQLMVGEVHWGFIGAGRQPSSQRAAETHERLCQHQYFAQTAKECCAFVNLPVVRGVAGQTIGAVAGKLCDGFDQWAKGNHLFDVPDDSGWIQNG